MVQSIPAAIGKQRFESRHVGRDHARLERDRFATADEGFLTQYSPKPSESLAQVLPRLGLEMRAPQQGHELVAAVGLRSRAGQEC